jgi:predicted amidohydrolase YtcJ
VTDVAAVDLLVSGGPLLTMDSQGSFFLDGAVAIDGGRIVTVGSAKAVTSSVSARAMLHASGKAILPGFVNCHGHTGRKCCGGKRPPRPARFQHARLFRSRSTRA